MTKESPSLKDIYEQVSLIVDTAATKDDLKSFATKDDLKKLATKEDMESLRQEIKLDIGKARDEAFVHADRKSEEVILEIGKIINKRAEPENKFKTKIVEVMKRNSLVSVKEINQLRQMI